MGLEFLARVRRTTIWLTIVVGLLVATYRGPAQGLALLLGAAWCLVNLLLIEKLVVALTNPDRNTPHANARAIRAITGMLLLFGVGALLLNTLSPIWLLGGFTVPFAVIVLKAASLMVLPSRLWKRLTASRWGAAAAVGVFVLGAWLATSGLSGAESHTEAVGHAASSAHTAAGEHSGESAGPEKFPNVISVIVRANPDAEWAHFLHRFEAVIFSTFIALLLCVFAFLATRNQQMIPKGLQNVVETLVETLDNFISGVLGPKHGRRYLPFLGSLFVYILAMNLFGLIPFMDSPTSSLDVTVALAIVVFLFSQFIGFKELGFVGYFDHLMGNPRGFIGWALVPLMLPIHVMGELAKPISLSCRLFGNIFGEDMLLVAFASLGVAVAAFIHSPLPVPLQLPFLGLALLTSTLQALVFTVLSAIYFLLMLPHDDHEHEGEAQHAH